MTGESIARTSGDVRKICRRVDAPLQTEREPLICSRALKRACDNLVTAPGREDV